ncbi:MAG: acyltransferase [Frankiales bacterium]|jgi:peptidoglycan/LPS O-acetylase OafA/YrhL|nr:acyltransferase [Frankiales bacterium]
MRGDQGREDLPLVLPRLTSTRAAAAFLVFVFHLAHYDVISRQPAPYAYSLLAYFFVLSGFVLTWSTSRRTPLPTYYWRRVARVWPNHLTMMLLALLAPVTVHQPTATAVLASLLLVQTWIPDGDVIFGVNAVSWSLSVEVAFYAVLPFLVPMLQRRTPRARWLVAGGLFALSSTTVLAGAHAGGNIATASYTFPPLRASEFLLGCVAALEVRRGWRLSGRTAATVAVVSLAAGFLLPHPLPSLNVFLTPMWLVLVVRCAQADIVGRSSLLTSRPLVYAGQLSFAFYLVHDLTILNLQHWLTLPATLLCVVMFAVSATGAAMLHHGVEQPAQRMLTGKRAPTDAADGPTPGAERRRRRSPRPRARQT